MSQDRAAEIAEVDWELTPEQAEDQACFRRGWEAAVRLFRTRYEAALTVAREEGRRTKAHHMTDDPKILAAELRGIADLLDDYEEFRFAPSDLRRIAAYLDRSAP